MDAPRSVSSEAAGLIRPWVGGRSDSVRAKAGGENVRSPSKLFRASLLRVLHIFRCSSSQLDGMVIPSGDLWLLVVLAVLRIDPRAWGDTAPHTAAMDAFSADLGSHGVADRAVAFGAEAVAGAPRVGAVCWGRRMNRHPSCFRSWICPRTTASCSSRLMSLHLRASLLRLLEGRRGRILRSYSRPSISLTLTRRAPA